jgi:hypothetical protein
MQAAWLVASTVERLAGLRAVLPAALKAALMELTTVATRADKWVDSTVELSERRTADAMAA